jgi:cytochrome c oxidase subunit I
MSAEDVPRSSGDGSYVSAGRTLRSWLLTTDHKRIGLLYLGAVAVMLIVGAGAGRLLDLPELSPTGGLMVWAVVIPSIPGVLGTFVVPMMLGARAVALPRLMLASWYLFLLGGACLLWTAVRAPVGPWPVIPSPFSPSSAMNDPGALAFGVLIVGASSVLAGLNVIVTTHRRRAPGLTWRRLPPFVWASYATSLVLVLATPVLVVTLALAVIERALGRGLLDPALGADPVLLRRLWAIYAHPAACVAILPVLGVTSELIATFSRTRVVGYGAVAGATIVIAVLGGLVWAYETLAGAAHGTRTFALLTSAIAVPAAITVVSWAATLWRGSITLATPMLYAMGVLTLVAGGSAVALVLLVGLELHVTDTDFVAVHLHVVMTGSLMAAGLGGLHYWWPKITGRLYPEGLGRLAAGSLLPGFTLVNAPPYMLGHFGLSRREALYAPEVQIMNVLSSTGAALLAVGCVLPVLYLLWSLGYGAPAGPNPWAGTTLEWTTASPPPTLNFAELPMVGHAPSADVRAPRDATAAAHHSS